MFEQKVKARRVLLILLPFSIVCLFFGLKILVSDEIIAPKSLLRLLDRYPDFYQLADVTLIAIGYLCVIFSVILLDISIKFIFFKKFKGMSVTFDSKRLTIPNFLTGENYEIPSSSLVSARAEGKTLTINYLTTAGNATLDLSEILIPNVLNLENEINKVSEEKSRNNYNIIYDLNSKKDNDTTSVIVLCKVLKLSSDDLKSRSKSGIVLIKQNVDKETSDKIIASLLKVGLHAQAVARKDVNVEYLHPIRYTLPTIPSLVLFTIVPGGILIWILLIDVLSRRLSLKEKLSGNCYVMAFFAEFIFSYSMWGDVSPTSDIILAMAGAMLVIMISFSIKPILEDEKKLSGLKTLFFNMAYINYSLNRRIEKKTM